MTTDRPTRPDISEQALAEAIRKLIDEDVAAGIVPATAASLPTSTTQ